MEPSASRLLRDFSGSLHCFTTFVFAWLLCGAAQANGNYPVTRWVIEGDTQSFSLSAKTLAHPNPWDRAHQWLCANAVSKNIQGIIGTGDIIYRYGTFGSDLTSSLRLEERAADYAYDITDACGLASILPAGNHDVYGLTHGYSGPPNNTDRYLGFMKTRPLHRPVKKSPTGLSWTWGLAPNFSLLVLPWAANAAEESWARTTIANSPSAERFFIFQHEGITPTLLPTIPSWIPAGRLAAQFGQRKVPMVIGGHHLQTDMVQSRLNSLGQRGLFVNFQEMDPRTNYSQPFWGYVVWLEYHHSTGKWCFWDENVLTGEKNRFEPTTCWVP